MKNHISRIANHVYVKNGLEAVKVYQDAFQLEIKDEPWLDDEGVLIYQELRLNEQLFLSVSEDKHLEDEIKKNSPNNIGIIMNNIVYFAEEEDLHRAFELLRKDRNPCTGIRYGGEQSDFICDVVLIDKFGVSWFLCVPKDWNLPLIPR